MAEYDRRSLVCTHMAILGDDLTLIFEFEVLILIYGQIKTNSARVTTHRRCLFKLKEELWGAPLENRLDQTIGNVSQALIILQRVRRVNFQPELHSNTPLILEDMTVVTLYSNLSARRHIGGSS